MAIVPRKRQRDGRTVYLVRRRDPDGRMYSRQFDTKAEAKGFEAQERADHSRGMWIDQRDGRKPLGTIADEWLRSNPLEAEGSLSKDRGILNTHVRPVLGARPAGSIKRSDIQDLVNAWMAQGYVNETVRRNYSCLRAVFTYAEDSHYISGDGNPCHKIMLPPRQRREPVIPADAELDRHGCLPVHGVHRPHGTALGRDRRSSGRRHRLRPGRASRTVARASPSAGS